MYSRSKITDNSSNLSTTENSRCNTFCVGYAKTREFDREKEYDSSFMRCSEEKTTIVLLEGEN